MHHLFYILLLILTISSSTSYASFNSDADTIFNWAENNYSELLKSKQNSQNVDDWYYRHYPEDDIYVGINTMGDVYSFIENKLQLEGSIEEFLDRIHKSDIQITDNSGNGQCVNIPLPDSGLEVSYSISAMGETSEFTIVYDNMSHTFAQSTARIDVNDIVNNIVNLANISDLGDVGDVTTQQNYQIIDNYLYLDSIEVNSTISLPYLGDTIIAVTTTNSEPQKIGPVLNYCEQQSWSTPVVTQSITSAAIYSIPETTKTTQSKLRGGSVEAINEEINISAGYFNTVRIKEYFDYGYVMTWFSIDNGIFVKAEVFDNSGELISQTEATMIQ